MTDVRIDTRDKGPEYTHRRAFMAGWTDAVNASLYQTVLKKKTHANMGNLFGWIYGEKPREFQLETWYRYLGQTMSREQSE